MDPILFFFFDLINLFGLILKIVSPFTNIKSFNFLIFFNEFKAPPVPKGFFSFRHLIGIKLNFLL